MIHVTNCDLQCYFVKFHLNMELLWSAINCWLGNYNISIWYLTALSAGCNNSSVVKSSGTEIPSRLYHTGWNCFFGIHFACFEDFSSSWNFSWDGNWMAQIIFCFVSLQMVSFVFDRIMTVTITSWSTSQCDLVFF